MTPARDLPALPVRAPKPAPPKPLTIDHITEHFFKGICACPCATCTKKVSADGILCTCADCPADRCGAKKVPVTGR